jgi:heme exporter protein D
MYFDSLSAALNMDGHGIYVWAVALVAVVIISSLIILPLRRERVFLRQLAGELKRQQGADNQSGQ